MSLVNTVVPQRIPSPPPLSGPEVKFHWMESLWVQVTGTLCNIACRHCFISCGPKADEVPLMTVEQVENALEEGRALGMRHIYYTGGEPFLHPQLRLLVDRALEIAPLSIITNGLLLDDFTVQWIAEVFHRSRYSFDLRVSLDGTTAAQNDPVRGRGTFTEIANAIQRLSGAGLSPVVTVVEHEQGLAAAEARTQFVEFLKGLGVRQPRLKFLPLLHIGREERRTHGYEGENPLSSDALQPEVEATLLCATGRIATAQGIFTCPILIKYPSARLGSNLADAARPIHLNWHACQTCVFDGLRCNT